MESKKDAFRKYLEGAGVIDAITKALVSLYEEPDKPVSGLEFLKTSLGAPTKAEHDALVAEKDSIQAQLDDAKATIEKLQAEIEGMKVKEEEPAPEAEEAAA
ncbi:hypothetical protein HKI87_01g07840 [Chloropicon roscoffensis]|uniref:c-Myc-binding protein n=1 Tax=Chloropicon roscoffensis TaxID=1461544 RepID=A0AAX4P035_9CHLO